MSARRHLVTAAGLILLGNLVSRILGLGREQVIAALFGETAVTSAFSTAATVPTIFYDLVVGGAVSAALVPVLSSFGESERSEEFGTVVGTLLVGAAVVLGALVLLLVGAAGPLATLLGVAPTRPIHEATAGFVRIVVPALLFLGLAGVVGAVCYARQRVVFPAFSIALFNGGLIVTALTLQRWLGATSLALGVVVGAFLQLLAVLPGLRGVSVRLTFQPGHPAIRQILRLYAPVAAGLVVSEIAVFVDRNLAWQTGENSVAIMRFATTLIQLPLGLVATATSLAALPLLSRLVDDQREFVRVLASGLRLALLAIVPATAFLVVFATPVVRLLFERGAFGGGETVVTARAFLLYAPQLPFVAVDQLLIYAFYARKNTLVPMLAGLGGVGLYLGSALLLIGPARLGLAGLILANTLQNSLHAVVLLILLVREAGSLAGLGVGGTLARALVAGGAAGVAGAALQWGLPVPAGPLVLALYLSLGATITAAAYVAALWALGVEEVSAFPKLLRARGRTPTPV